MNREQIHSEALRACGNGAKPQGFELGAEWMQEQIPRINDLARQNPGKEFLMTLIGCGIAGFRIEEIRDLCHQVEWQPNVVLPEEFKPKK